MSEGVFVHQLALGPWDNFITFIGDADSRTCAVVDPAWDAATILAEAQRLDVRITHVLCTHSHFDHVDQVEPLLETVDVPVYMSRAEVEFSGFRCNNLQVTSPGDTLRIGTHVDVTMMHTPGHTPGSTSYRVSGAIVTGDTLFVDGCGRCDFVGGDPETMFTTLRTLMAGLPGDTTMYPGHDYGGSPSSTVDEQLAQNPYLQHGTVEDFVRHRMDGKSPQTSLPPRPDWKPPG
ncbi:MAG: MBL fold metallo-hydrolase [Deltaproteobacteria bacterium]|nr:MBL fold metallo-hydrolase [Deltaproteobacteria bacterium]